MKIIPESKIVELLKDKKIDQDSYRKSFSPLPKPEEKTLEEKRLDSMAKQTLAIEKLSALLEKSLTSKQPDLVLPILEKIMQKDSSMGNLGLVLKEHFEKLVTMFRESKSVDQPARPRIKKLWVRRDLNGRLDYVEPEYED